MSRQAVPRRPVHLHVNGEDREVYIRPSKTLLDVVRDDLGLTGVKECCGTGDCGACTLLVDGKAVASCLLLAVEAEGKAITTIEGLSAGGSTHPLQQAFVAAHASQCGFCTPGMILAAQALLDEVPDPTDEQIKEALAGNLCRCTGYYPILAAVRSVAGKQAAGNDTGGE